MSLRSDISRGVDITLDGNRGRLFVGDADTASVAITLVRGDLTALVVNVYSSPDGYSVPANKGALATFGASAEMTADFSTKGFPWLVWEIDTAGTTTSSLADIYAFGKRNTA